MVLGGEEMTKDEVKEEKSGRNSTSMVSMSMIYYQAQTRNKSKKMARGCLSKDVRT
jgi:hypothetical protein